MSSDYDQTSFMTVDDEAVVDPVARETTLAGGLAPEEAAAEDVAADVTADAAADVPGELTEGQLEALLFVAERPLARSEIASLTGVDRETVDARIGDLQMSLAERGIRLVESGERVELTTAPEAGRLIARYVGADAPKLSGPSLETLAIVAYRQPCTRATVERIRGVDSDYTLRTLLHRRLVVELGRSDAPGRPTIFGTGFDFLERFGLTSLDELPPLEVEVAERLFAEPDEDLAGTDAGDDTDTLGLDMSIDRDESTVVSADDVSGSVDPAVRAE